MPAEPSLPILDEATLDRTLPARQGLTSREPGDVVGLLARLVSCGRGARRRCTSAPGPAGCSTRREALPAL